MKLKYILTVIVFAIIGNLTAQDWSTNTYRYGELYEGYIIDLAGKKTEGFIKYDDRYSMQNDITFYVDKNDKKNKVKYKTEELTEYKVADKLYHCIHYSGGLFSKPVRGNLVVNEGCIMEYVWYNRSESYLTMQRAANESDEDFYGRMYPPVTVYKKKDDQDCKTMDSFALKFASKMSEWIADNKELAKKVSDSEKGYGAMGILRIIEEYNMKCAAE
jgi:hypothetical protein